MVGMRQSAQLWRLRRTAVMARCSSSCTGWIQCRVDTGFGEQGPDPASPGGGASRGAAASPVDELSEPIYELGGSVHRLSIFLFFLFD